MPKFVPRQRKQKAKERQTQNGAADSNILQLLPVNKDEREARRQQLRAQLRAEQLANSKTTSKKKKRLDKYIVSIYT
jgi:ATP-dependent RNA helicase DHX37/DHR1